MKNIITRIKQFLTTLLFTGLTFSLIGCFNDDAVDQKYFKTFEYIKTDQFVWSYGRGGIYWVSTNAVVLDAVVKNSEGVPERGIYQVNMDGSYIRLAKKINNGPFDYCFDGDTLFIRGGEGQFETINYPEGYDLVIQNKIALNGDGPYQAIRCKNVKPPRNDGGYVTLKYEDGFIKNKYRTENNPNPYTYLADNSGNSLRVLDVGEIKIFSKAKYLFDRNSYFFYRNFKNCAHLSWIDRQSWNVSSKKLCFGLWAKSSSKIILSTKKALFVTHYAGGKKTYKAYMVKGEKEYPLETVSLRGAALATNGCQVAYGSGEIGFAEKRFSQVLKVFNSCQFMEDKGE